MNDGELTSAWAALEPSARRRRRIEAQVFEWLEARDESLASEWLGLLKVQPVAGLAFAVVGLFSLIAITPLGWLAFSILS